MLKLGNQAQIMFCSTWIKCLYPTVIISYSNPNLMSQLPLCPTIPLKCILYPPALFFISLFFFLNINRCQMHDRYLLSSSLCDSNTNLDNDFCSDQYARRRLKQTTFQQKCVILSSVTKSISHRAQLPAWQSEPTSQQHVIKAVGKTGRRR